MISKDEYDKMYELIRHGFGTTLLTLSNEDKEELIKKYFSPILL